MQKVKDFCSSKYFTFLLLTVGMATILYYYFSKVPGLFTVWNLVDEYGYMANAAYLSGTEWAWLSNMYYGYGYSLWLIPLFWLCDSGVGMIRAAVMFNGLCAAGIFFVQYLLMSKLCKNINKNLIAVMSFALSFYPYIVSSGLKVICEVLLTLVVWIIGLMLYQAFESGKWYYYVLAAVSTVYMFFVHTRTFVFCGVIILVVGSMFLLKKVSWKQLAIFGGTALVLLVIGFALKNNIVDAVYSQEIFPSTEEVVADVAVGNMMSVSYIFNRILRVFTNFSMRHIYAFACRNFYLFVATLGMFHVGVVAGLKDAFKEFKIKKEISAVNAIKLLYAMGVVVMLVATVVQSTGSLTAPSYLFYGRYYEYIIGPVVFLGLDYCINNKVKLWGIVFWLFGFGVTIWLTMEMANLLEVQELYFDSTKMASFALVSGKDVYYRAVVRSTAKIGLVAMLVILALNYVKKLRVLIPTVLFVIFMLNNRVITKNILTLQANNRDDYEISVYVDTYYPDVEEVYFLNNEGVHVTYYSAVQCLLGHTKLVMLEGNNAGTLETGDIFVTFRNNAHLGLIESPITKMWETQYYELYMVE